MQELKDMEGGERYLASIQEKLNDIKNRINFLYGEDNSRKSFSISLDSMLFNLLRVAGYFQKVEKQAILADGFDRNKLSLDLETGEISLELVWTHPHSNSPMREENLREMSPVFSLKTFWEKHLDNLCWKKAEEMWENQQKEKRKKEIQDIIFKYLP